MVLRTEWETPPTDYTLIVPHGWFQIPLDPDHRDPSIIALADQQFAGIDDAPVLKQRLMRDLQKQCKAAYRNGGLELYLSLITVGDLPLASSLLVSLIADGYPNCRTPHDLAARLNSIGREATVTRLEGSGDAVRQQRTEAPDPASQMGNTMATTTVVYNIAVPASEKWLSLTFSTPLETIAPRMVELFDTVAGTLHWE